ncbi:hypothetical protein [Segatella oulorum]|uniref:hypothetical protein n=1 Tax=Segatella oulorum TaxID=28136 RepID=UPI0028E79B7F|nr:hypothetical protein [Segatella oulorum]
MKKQATKRAYIKPESKVYPMAVESLLDAASGNAGTIGYGGDAGDAKKHNGDWDDWDEEEEEVSTTTSSSLFNE